MYKCKNIIKYIKNPLNIILYFGVRGKLNFINDSIYLKLMYRDRLGKKLNLDEPKTFNEKLQWLKLYDRNPMYTNLVDKYKVRNYVSDKIGEEYLIPILGVYDKFEDIEFNDLPDQFVIKCTHDSGGLVICKDKSKLNKDLVRNKLNKCLKRNYYYHGREWPYKNVKPRIIIEKFMKETNEEISKYGLIDYKFYCFNGEPKFLYVSQGLEDHETAQISFFDLEFEKLPFGRTDFDPLTRNIPKPLNFEKMKVLCTKLSENIDFVRVDLYEINGKIYFSELTFTPTSGMMQFEPAEYDYEIGKMLDLTIK